jgi:NADH dehydrogenase
LAAAAVAKAVGNTNEIVNAIGPETFTYRELIGTIKRILGVKRLVVGVPPALGYLGCRSLGLFVRDVIITWEEVRGLMENRLWVDAPPLGATKLTKWIEEHRENLGQHYTSEMARRVDRRSAYRSN